jgi:hypothetical protein
MHRTISATSMILCVRLKDARANEPTKLKFSNQETLSGTKLEDFDFHKCTMKPKFSGPC